MTSLVEEILGGFNLLTFLTFLGYTLIYLEQYDILIFFDMPKIELLASTHDIYGQFCELLHSVYTLYEQVTVHFLTFRTSQKVAAQLLGLYRGNVN